MSVSIKRIIRLKNEVMVVYEVEDETKSFSHQFTTKRAAEAFERYMYVMKERKTKHE